jgi:murein DD-endopeptidase MepM/ murein hydrolase activator NlpD
MQMIQSGIIARASAGNDNKFSSAMTSKDPNSMLDVLGVDKSSPIRSNFRFNSSENRKLESTEEGLVGGYNVSLRTTAALNDAYSTMADTLGPVNDGLMTLKGILQTLPNAGTMGGAISGFIGALAGLASTIIQVTLVSRLLGGAGAAGLLGKGAGLATGAAALGAGAVASLGAGAVGFGTGKAGKAVGNKIGASNTTTRVGSTLAGMGTGAAIGAGIGSVVPVLGTGIGAVVGTIAGGLGGFFGSGGPSDHSNFGIGGESPTSYPSPVPAKTPVTSPFGPRDNSKHPGISANHRGIDFGTPVGTALTAIANGVVSVVGNDPDGYGSWIEVKHEDGTASRYGHLSQINVSKGQEVKPGQVVARSGGKPGTTGAGSSTGPHVHFEILNQKGVKIDPAPYLSGSPAGPIESATPAIPGPEPISSDSMWAAKKAATNAAANLGKDATQLSSIGLSSSLTSSGFNEDLGGPATGGPMGGMNMGVADSSNNNSKNVVINLQMKVNIAQGSVQEADRLVKLVGKKLTDSDVLKKIGSAL